MLHSLWNLPFLGAVPELQESYSLCPLCYCILYRQASHLLFTCLFCQLDRKLFESRVYIFFFFFFNFQQCLPLMRCPRGVHWTVEQYFAWISALFFCGKSQIHSGPAQTVCAGLKESLEIAPKCYEGWQIAFSLNCYKAEDFSSAFSEEEDQ